MATLDKKKVVQNRRKLGVAFCTSTIIELLLAPYVAYIIHQYFLLFLNPGERFYIDYSYLKSLTMLFDEFGVLMWFLVIQACYFLWMIYIAVRPRGEITSVNTIVVTDKISIPVPVGNGQYGTARFCTEKEQADIFEEIILTNKNISYLKKKGGVVVSMERRNGSEHIKVVKGDVHTLIIGATGAGKTRRVLLQTLCLQLLSGISVVISDVKGEIYYYTSGLAKQLGYKVIVLDYRNPKKSMHYNCLQPILDALDAEDVAQAIDYTWDLVSVLVGEPKGEPLWYNGETATIAAAILVVCLEAPVACRNPVNIYYFLAYMCQQHPETGITPLALYLATLDDEHPAKIVFAMAQVSAHRTRASFFTSALGTLRLFTNPNVADMSSKSDFKLEDIGKEKTIVYMIIPDENKKLYPLASILIQQIYMAQVQLANKSGLRLPVDTDYDLDEVGNFPTIPVLGNMLSAGRSRGIRVIPVIQDYQQLQTKYKDDFETIKTCCRVKIYLKSDNTKTLEEISKTLDKYTVEVTSASTSSNLNLRGNDGSVSSSSSMAGRSLLTPGEISRIDYPYGLCMVTGEYPSIVNLPDLSKYYFNELLGLGDEEHNRKMILLKESERKERKTGEVEFWGVWVKYKELLEEDAIEKISFLQ